MSDPRFRPRDYLVHPKTFGITDAPKPLEASSIEERARAGAAVYQSRLARQVRVLMAEHDVTQVEFSAAIEMKAARLSRLLNGTAILRVEDIYRFQCFFNDRSVGAFAEPEAYDFS